MIGAGIPDFRFGLNRESPGVHGGGPGGPQAACPHGSGWQSPFKLPAGLLPPVAGLPALLEAHPLPWRPLAALICRRLLPAGESPAIR